MLLHHLRMPPQPLLFFFLSLSPSCHSLLRMFFVQTDCRHVDWIGIEIGLNCGWVHRNNRNINKRIVQHRHLFLCKYFDLFKSISMHMKVSGPMCYIHHTSIIFVRTTVNFRFTYFIMNDVSITFDSLKGNNLTEGIHKCLCRGVTNVMTNMRLLAK